MYLVIGGQLCTNSWSTISLGTGYDDLTALGQEAKAMAEKVIDVGLTPVEEYYGSEVTLYYPGLYAGSQTLSVLHNGRETIVDFKQANRPKKKEWIEDYYLQIAAYAMAHDYVHQSNIEQGVIMVCTPDLYYQEFVVSGAELRQYKHKFLKRLDMYHDLIFDEKEKAKPMNPEDFLMERKEIHGVITTMVRKSWVMYEDEDGFYIDNGEMEDDDEQ